MTLQDAPRARTVLLVDDEDSVRTASRRLLERDGYAVMAASSAMDAWRLFLEQPGRVDIVVTDLSMPEMSGSELATRIRTIAADVPVIVTSAYSPGDGQRAWDSFDSEMAQAILIKPFTGSVLLETVQHVLDEHRGRVGSGAALPH